MKVYGSSDYPCGQTLTECAIMFFFNPFFSSRFTRVKAYANSPYVVCHK